jgi:hypothetical protein
MSVLYSAEHRAGIEHFLFIKVRKVFRSLREMQQAKTGEKYITLIIIHAAFV